VSEHPASTRKSGLRAGERWPGWGTYDRIAETFGQPRLLQSAMDPDEATARVISILG
jgi:hypothetical protein